MRTSGQLRREEAFDVWLDERFGSSTASGSDRAHETPADWDADLEAMAKVAEFVCLLAPVDPTTAVPYAPPPHRLPSPLRIAAVVMLLLGLASGLWLVASRSGHAPEVPAGTVTPGLMPSGLYAELETQAGTSGNPYPSTPVLWVKTTAGATENLLRDYHVGSQPGVSAGTVEWMRPRWMELRSPTVTSTSERTGRSATGSNLESRSTSSPSHLLTHRTVSSRVQ